MENKRGNFEKDKILGKIFLTMSAKGHHGQSSYSRTQYSRKNTSRNSGGSNIPRKQIRSCRKNEQYKQHWFCNCKQNFD